MPRTRLDPERAEYLYSLGWPTTYLAKEFDVSPQAVGNALRKQGVQLRRPGGTRRTEALAPRSVRRRCPDCCGLFPPSGFYWSKGVQDTYCKGCRKQRIVASTSPAQRKAAKDRYVEKHGREKINADERRRKNHLTG